LNSTNLHIKYKEKEKKWKKNRLGTKVLFKKPV